MIERLLEGRSNLMSFAGIFANDTEFDLMAHDILEVRKKTVLKRC